MKEKSKPFRTPRGRLSFPALDAPTAMDEGQEPKYQATILINKQEDLRELNAQIDALIKETWPKGRPQGLKMPIRDGAEKADLAGYSADVWFMTARSKNPVPVVNNIKALLDPKEAYAGCWVRLSVTPYAFDKKTAKGIGLALNAVQKIGDGEPFASRVNVDEAFDEEEEFNSTADTPWG